ncbi:MAG: glucose 1-dehydrogenase [Parahaliea sp.]
MSEKKVVVVTGGGQGIGQAIAERLAADGFNVAINDINPKTAEAVCTALRDKGCDATLAMGDVSKRDQVHAMVDKVLEHYGRLDVMVANAGVIKIATMMDTTEEDLDFMHSINVKGMLWCAQAAAKAMIAQGGGKIIAASSTCGHTGTVPLMGAYSGTKFSVRGLTQALAAELAPHGITVNAYCPGVVETSMWEESEKAISAITGAAKGEPLQAIVEQIPLGRHQQPSDVANLVSFLASSDADYITGQALMANGGGYMV